MSDVKILVDVWLDAELGPVDATEQAADRRLDRSIGVAVAAAVHRGRRLRLHRRVLATGAMVAATAAATAGVVALNGVSSVSVTPTPARIVRPTITSLAPPTPLSGGYLIQYHRTQPIDVGYPAGSGTRTVTWPAPANGWVWRVPFTVSMPVDEAARAFRDGVRATVGAGVPELTRSSAGAGGPDVGGGTDGVRVRGIDGEPTEYLTSFQLLDADRSGTFVARITLGGIADGDRAYDPCGHWPAGVPGLGYAAPNVRATCSLTSGVDSRGADLIIVHYEITDVADGAGSRIAFAIRSDGTAVHVQSSATTQQAGVPRLRAPVGWDLLDELVGRLAWPGRTATGSQPLAVVYPAATGRATTIRWPAPASGLPWAVDHPSVTPDAGAVHPVTAGARELAARLRAAVPGAAATSDGDGAEVIGWVDGFARAYRATVSVPAAAGTGGSASAWTVSMTRGGVTSRPVVFDLCGRWPVTSAGLGMRDHEKSVWFEDYGTPRECSTATLPGGRPVVHLVVRPPARSETGVPPLQVVAFTVRADGTAVSARALAPAGTRPAVLFTRLDRLVAELPYPTHP